MVVLWRWLARFLIRYGLNIHYGANLCATTLTTLTVCIMTHNIITLRHGVLHNGTQPDDTLHNAIKQSNKTQT